MTRIGEHRKKESEIQEGDTVVMSKTFLNSFESHCEDENDIPLCNHGVVTKVIKPNDKTDKGKYLHPCPHNSVYGQYDYITFRMPNGKEESMFSKDLRKLY